MPHNFILHVEIKKGAGHCVDFRGPYPSICYHITSLVLPIVMEIGQMTSNPFNRSLKLGYHTGNHFGI